MLHPEAWDRPERRQTLRVEQPGGHAFCQRDSWGAYYKILDLSVGGVQLCAGPAMKQGTKVDVVIFAGDMGMAQLPGHVVRRGKSGRSIAIAFDDVPSADEARLADLVTNALVSESWALRWFR